jgi:hypothetical protein
MKLPFISRSRYEREIKQLREAYEVRTGDLRERLAHLIAAVTHIRMYPAHGAGDTEIAVKVRLPSELRENFILSPFQREEFWWHVGQNIIEQIKANAMLRYPQDSARKP